MTSSVTAHVFSMVSWPHLGCVFLTSMSLTMHTKKKEKMELMLPNMFEACCICTFVLTCTDPGTGQCPGLHATPCRLNEAAFMQRGIRIDRMKGLKKKFYGFPRLHSPLNVRSLYCRIVLARKKSEK